MEQFLGLFLLPLNCILDLKQKNCISIETLAKSWLKELSGYRAHLPPIVHKETNVFRLGNNTKVGAFQTAA